MKHELFCKGYERAKQPCCTNTQHINDYVIRKQKLMMKLDDTHSKFKQFISTMRSTYHSLHFLVFQSDLRYTLDGDHSCHPQ